MNIAYFTEFFPYINRLNDVDYFRRYHHGGTETVAYNLAINMARRGHKVSIFTTSINSHSSIKKFKNLIIYRCGTNFRIRDVNFSLNLFRKPLKYQFDIVHAHANNPPADLAALLHAKSKKNPFVLTLHGLPDKSYGGFIRKQFFRFYDNVLLPKLLATAKIIIVPSYGLIKENSLLSNTYKDKVVVIPHGIDTSSYNRINSYAVEKCRKILGLPLNKKIIFYLGALEAYKGVDILIKAMPAIVKEDKDIELVIAGKGSMENVLKRLSISLKMKKYIRFVGFIKDSLKPFYYRSTNIFVLPSVSHVEAFGIVNLEAMASMLPIVATNITGIPEIIEDGETGLLVPPKDTKALADAIMKLLDDESLAKKMGVNGRKIVEEKYTWDKLAKMTEKVYNEVTS